MPWCLRDGQFDKSDGLTRFQVYVGPDTAFENPQGHTLTDFANGTNNTMLITEGEQRVPWTKPVDLPFGPEVVLVRPHVRNIQSRPGSWVLRADGSCRLVPADTPEETLRAFITRSKHDAIEWP